jgi:hypothetical protein
MYASVLRHLLLRRIRLTHSPHGEAVRPEASFAVCEAVHS